MCRQRTPRRVKRRELRPIGCRSRQHGLVLTRRSLKFLELQLELAQLGTALGGGAEPVLPESGDQQLEVVDHRLGTRGPRLRLLAGCTLSHQGGA